MFNRRGRAMRVGLASQLAVTRLRRLNKRALERWDEANQLMNLIQQIASDEILEHVVHVAAVLHSGLESDSSIQRVTRGSRGP